VSSIQSEKSDFSFVEGNSLLFVEEIFLEKETNYNIQRISKEGRGEWKGNN